MSDFEIKFSEGTSNSFKKSVIKSIELFIEEHKLSKRSIDYCPSIESFKKLNQFSHFFNDFYYDVFIDFSTGVFGIHLRNKEKNKLLNLVFQENNEVIFSFIYKQKGITKISGRSTFSENFSDIKLLTNMLIN